jgi:hypothetical protein
VRVRESFTYGTISGAGTFAEGSSVPVTATPNGSHSFVNWTQNGKVVGLVASYTSTAQRQYHADGVCTKGPTFPNLPPSQYPGNERKMEGAGSTNNVADTKRPYYCLHMGLRARHEAHQRPQWWSRRDDVPYPSRKLHVLHDREPTATARDPVDLGGCPRGHYRTGVLRIQTSADPVRRVVSLR